VILVVAGIATDLVYHWTAYSYTASPLTADQIVGRQKTLWDWLELLLIPLVLAVGGLWFSQAERRNEHAIAEQNARRERAIADAEAQEAALQAYLEQMSNLLMSEGLRNSVQDDEVRAVARAWTLTVLRRVKGERKGTVLRFLYEAGLIMTENTIVSLAGANLSGASVSGTNLFNANLFEADLRRANLRDTDLGDADLRHVRHLRSTQSFGVILGAANLLGADLHGSTYNSRTQWPAGFDPQASGAIFVEE
jgi:hypothetical protein